MYTLKNKYGNIYKTVNSERKKEYLIGLGYTEVMEEKKPRKNNSTKGVKKNGFENYN